MAPFINEDTLYTLAFICLLLFMAVFIAPSAIKETNEDLQRFKDLN